MINFDQNFLQQLPGLFIAKDLNSKYIATNFNVAKALGFLSIEKTVGITDYDLKHGASNCAEEFIKQDQLSLRHGVIETLDVHHYRDSVSIWYGSKAPFKNTQGEITGVLYNGMEQKQNFLAEIIVGLSQNDKRYLKHVKKNHDTTYYINYSTQTNLTKKEFEILFFLIRGRSIKEIAKLLHRSPRTIEVHAEHIKAKLNINNKTDLIDYAVTHCLFNIIPKSLLTQEMTLILG